MSIFNNQGELMGDWHKCPNIVTDRLVGQVISPNAGWVVVYVWRLTEGLQRPQAAIPTERFMSLLAMKKKETAYKFVKEAVSSGLINVKKERGMVNIYSINKDCSLWNRSEVATKIEPTPKNGSTENGDYLDPKNGTRVVPQNGTGVVPKMGTLIKTKENIKENTKESSEATTKKTEPQIPKTNQSGFAVTEDLEISERAKTVCSQKADHILNWNHPDFATAKEILFLAGKEMNLTGTEYRMSVEDFKAYYADQADLGKGLTPRMIQPRFRDWLINDVNKKSRQPQQTNYQGQNYANHQSTNSQPQQYDTSTTAGYAAKLDADAAAYYARQAAEQSTY